MMIYVAPIVEGETEEICIKPLLSRIWRELLNAGDLATLSVLEPIPATRSALVKPTHPELEDKVERAAIRLQLAMRHSAIQRGFILIMIDTDEDSAVVLRPHLVARAKLVRSDMDIVCVMPNREFENWFKAAAESLAGVGGLPRDLKAVPNPETGSGDNWLDKQIRSAGKGLKYKKPGDALILTQQMNLGQCRANSPSFAILCAELEARVPLPPVAPEADVPA